MAKHPTEKSATPHEKITFTVEACIPGESVREKLEWLQKNFDYFHPTFQAKVVYNGEVMIGREPAVQPKPDMPQYIMEWLQTVPRTTSDDLVKLEVGIAKAVQEVDLEPDPLSLV